MKATPTALWYLTRGTGLVALVVLTATVVLGVLTTSGYRSAAWPRFVSRELHRNLSLFSVALIALHVVTTVADGFAPIGFIDAVVPFHSPYRPIWLGLGALAFDMLLAVGITSALRQRIGYRNWRAVHWLAYASWPVALLHGLGTGSDSSVGPVLLLEAACLAAVLGAAGWRITRAWPDNPGRRLATGSSLSVLVVAVVIFAVVGPLAPGWSRRAGTPAAILAAGRRAAGAPAASGAAAASTSASTAGSGSQGALPAVPFSARLSGRISTSGPDSSGNVTITIQGDGLLAQGGSLPFVLTLDGTPSSGGGVALSSGNLRLGSAQGQVVGLSGDLVEAQLGTGQSQVPVSLRLAIDSASGSVGGEVRVGGYDGGGGGAEGDGGQ